MFIGFFTACVSSFFFSAIGICLIVRGIHKDTQFFNGSLRVPLWFLVVSGVLRQVPFIIYFYITYISIREEIFP
jgi:hypothetical protein